MSLERKEMKARATKDKVIRPRALRNNNLYCATTASVLPTRSAKHANIYENCVREADIGPTLGRHWADIGPSLSSQSRNAEGRLKGLIKFEQIQ